MNFIATTFRICSGTSVFLELMRFSVRRALFHFLLLALLLSIILTMGNNCRMNPELERACAEVFTETGGFSVSENGLATLGTPETAKHLDIMTSKGKLRFEYVPGTLSAETVKGWPEDALFGVVCMRRGLLSWIVKPRNPADGTDTEYIVFPSFLDNELISKQVIGVMTAEEFSAFANENFTLPAGKKLVLKRGLSPEHFKTPGFVSGMLTAGTGVVFFIGSFCGSVLFVLLTVLFFSFLQQFRFGAITKRPGFKENFVVMLYTAFPALIVASLFSLADFPFFPFPTVFLIVFFIYHIFVYNTICKSLNPPSASPDGD